MSIITFGEALLSTGDLDPVYLAIQRAELDDQTLARLCLAYWCFYSLGTAAYIAHYGKKPSQFWELMTMAAENVRRAPAIPTGLSEKPWPRGAERRHFRGANAVGPMSYLKEHYKTAWHAVSSVLASGDEARPTFGGVSARVQAWPGFGPWMAFKIADMGERVLGYPVDFDNCELGIYKDPRQGAAVAWMEWHTNGAYANKDPWNYPITDTELRDTVKHYIKAFSKFKAPGGDRKVNVQEVETIFCKYKSHLKGHYPLGKDTREVHHGLQGWGPLAERLDEALIAATS